MLPGTHLINAMINAQAVNGILLPVILVFMVSLINRKDVMGDYTNSKFYNIIAWLLTVVLIILTIAWLVGLILGYS
jgi:Mn2+/Fe2+ NRAMP family transporter